MSFHFDPIDDGLEFEFDLWAEPLVSPTSLLAEASDVEFSREEWLAFKQFEYAGYPTDDDPESFVEDDAGEDPDPWGWNGGAEPIRVSQWQLQSDRDTLAHLHRDWRGLYRVGPNGERVVRGAHPFSTDEGSAEWLQRARIEMRFLYAEAKSDAERSAIRAREAALRARHNARCWARAFARYHRLDENQTLGMLNAWQKKNPIGWLGLEAAMKSLFEGCWDHYYAEREAWNADGDNLPPSWMTGVVEQSTKDEWLDREPQPPLHPTQLVTSHWVDDKGRTHKSIRKDTRPRPVVVEEFTTYSTRIVDGKAVTTAKTTRARRVADHRASTVERVGELGVSGTPREVSERRKAEARRDELAAQRIRREALAAAPRVSRGNVRRWLKAAAQDTEQFAARKEYERAEMPPAYVEGENTRARLAAAGVTPDVVAAFYRERDIERKRRLRASA